MLVLQADEKTPKCFLTQGPLPKWCDLEQAPSKQKPFSTVLATPFVHKVDLILPDRLHSAAWRQITESLPRARYARCVMKLSDVLTGQFFNEYIKKGNVALLSEGRPQIDPIFSLSEGQLKLELPKQLYETAGLIGQPIPDGGRKHSKNRFLVEYDLRLASMVHGRKAFDRLYWASKNALGQSMTWLFYDFESKFNDGNSPLVAYEPVFLDIEPQISQVHVKVPPMCFDSPLSSDSYQEDALSVLEWLDLVAMSSPRILPDDTIDPWLSRYSSPAYDHAIEQQVFYISWTGFIPSRWCRDLLMRCLNAAMKSPDHWFSLAGYYLWPQNKDSRLGWTILRQPADEAQHWVDRQQDQQENQQLSSSATCLDSGNSKAPPRFILYEMTAE